MNTITPTWKDIITDKDEIKVFKALDKPFATWRTVGAVSRETGLSPLIIWDIVTRYDQSVIQISETVSASGYRFIGLAENIG